MYVCVDVCVCCGCVSRIAHCILEKMCVELRHMVVSVLVCLCGWEEYANIVLRSGLCGLWCLTASSYYVLGFGDALYMSCLKVANVWYCLKNTTSSWFAVDTHFEKIPNTRSEKACSN